MDDNHKMLKKNYINCLYFLDEIFDEKISDKILSYHEYSKKRNDIIFNVPYAIYCKVLRINKIKREYFKLLENINIYFSKEISKLILNYYHDFTNVCLMYENFYLPNGTYAFPYNGYYYCIIA